MSIARKHLKTFFVLAGFFVAAVFVFLPKGGVFASMNVVSISDAHKYAWADRAGWINFFTLHGQ